MDAMDKRTFGGATSMEWEGSIQNAPKGDKTMSEEFKEFNTFIVTDKSGNEVELAVVDEFEYEHKSYVAGALIVDDAVSEDGVYIYRAKIVDEEIIAEKITDMEEYQKVSKAYMEMGE